jgi:hypothetical protein
MRGLRWFRMAAAAMMICRAGAEETCYLFSYFTGNGEDGLHLAWSRDGLQWDALKGGASFLTPAVGGKLMRDPCVLQGPDGIFHMVWTDSWKGTTIGYASSRDLVIWSEQKSLPVMKDEPTTMNCWAPELAYDPGTKSFTIFWASTIPGRFPESELEGRNDSNHRIYATSTKDFVGFSPTRLFFDPGFNCIDSTILPHNGRFVMFFKDETKFPKPMKNLRIATADTISGKWKVQEKPVTDPDSWFEGPSALSVGDEVILYFDAYRKHHYAAMKSTDLETWTDVTPQLRMPKGIRHGTAFSVSRNILEALLKPEAP